MKEQEIEKQLQDEVALFAENLSLEGFSTKQIVAELIASAFAIDETEAVTMALESCDGDLVHRDDVAQVYLESR
jgi:hypothetical protein